MLSFLAKPWFFSLVLAFALLAPDRAAADDRFAHHRRLDRIVVFGDSLSDPGNAFALNGGQTVAPPDYGMTTASELLQLIPAAPYATRRFSNGPTWIELLAGTIGLGSSAKPAFVGSDGRASNYAVGGATAADLTALGGSPFHLTVQVDNFFLDFDVRKRGAPSDALYVIAIGGNDVRAALAAGPGVFTLSLAAVGQNIQKLYLAGARKFLVWNAPNLGLTPAIQRLNAFGPPGVAGVISGAATALSAGYNEGLQGDEGVLQGLGALPGIEIVQFDAFGTLGAVVANPGRFGLRNATDACIQPNVPPLFRCTLPDRHFFWDGIHPTRAGHAIMAFLVGKTLVAHALQDD